MQIASGRYRHRTLRAPKGMRPTQARVRQAIFNSLQAEWHEGLKILDLCCGSGSLGIEALSRGAGSVVFLDRDRAAINYLKRNLKGLEDRSRILKQDLVRGLSALARHQFDLIFFDPPYNQDLIPRALELIARLGLLAPGGTIVVEHHRREGIPIIGEIKRYRERYYGDTIVTYLKAR